MTKKILSFTDMAQFSVNQVGWTLFNLLHCILISSGFRTNYAEGRQYHINPAGARRSRVNKRISSFHLVSSIWTFLDQFHMNTTILWKLWQFLNLRLFLKKKSEKISENPLLCAFLSFSQTIFILYMFLPCKCVIVIWNVLLLCSVSWHELETNVKLKLKWE